MGLIILQAQHIGGITMALDLKKCFMAALLPAATVNVLLIVMAFLILIAMMVAHILNDAMYQLVMIIGILLLLIIPLGGLTWSGHRAVKKYGVGLVGGAATGVLTGGLSALIWGCIMLICNRLMTPLATSQDIIVITAFFIITGAIVGAVCGAIGAFIASKKIVFK
jgi:hypothetical protein